jgi:hypothetical protein
MLRFRLLLGRPLLGAAIIAATFFPGAAASAPSWTEMSVAVHDASLGGLFHPRRRCTVGRPVPAAPARVMPRVMPRADEAVRLAFNFDKGPAYYVQTTTETVQSMTVMGQQVQQKQVQTYTMQWTPQGIDQDGYGLLTIKIIGIKMDIDIGGVRIFFDSIEGRPASDPLSGFLKELVGAEFQYAVDRNDMTVKRLAGHEELIRRLAPTHPQVEPLLKSIVNRDALAQVFPFDWLPRDAVRRGDGWRRQTALNLGPIGTYRTSSDYIYDGPAKSLERIRVQTTLRYEAPKNGARLPFVIKGAALTTTAGSGEILFDARRGRLASSDAKLVLTGRLTIEVGGMQTDVALEQTQIERSRVSDDNPLASRQH